MTKKQMKKLAKEVAELERIIQFSQDKNEINEAKDKQVHLMDSADLELAEMLELDLLVQKYL
jgi:protein subunit release factor A